MRVVFKDVIWLVLQSFAMIAVFFGVMMASRGSDYWVSFIILSSVLMYFAVQRAVKITNN